MSCLRADNGGSAEDHQGVKQDGVAGKMTMEKVLVELRRPGTATYLIFVRLEDPLKVPAFQQPRGHRRVHARGSPPTLLLVYRIFEKQPPVDSSEILAVQQVKTDLNDMFYLKLAQTYDHSTTS